MSSPRRSSVTPRRRRRESSESFATSESDGSPLRGAAAGNSAVFGTLAGLGVGGGLGPVDPAVSLTTVNALTASELALKVIPAINALKALLVGLTKSVAGLPVLEAAVVELKAG